jgi:tagatose-1,6-bisphosphate aldolase
MKMTTAEFRGYQQLCERGGGPMMVIACDQRGGMRKLLVTDPKEEGGIGQDILGDTKSDIVEFLGNHASCVLLDPVCAVPRVIDEAVLARECALLIGLDDSGWDVQPDTRYRLSKLVPGINARRVRELGGTGGKIMVYLRSDLPAANEHNIRILKQVIADFAAEDLLLVVEFLTYQVDGESAGDYASKFSALIEGGTKICLEVGSKVLKLPYPGTGEACANVSKLCGDVPWAVLSAGVDHEHFIKQIEIAMANGASGVIGGRALWKDCISLDRAVQRDRLTNVALPRLRQIQAVLAGYRPRHARRRFDETES